MRPGTLPDSLQGFRGPSAADARPASRPRGISPAALRVAARGSDDMVRTRMRIASRFLSIVLLLGSSTCANKAARDLVVCERQAAGPNVAGAIDTCRGAARDYSDRLEGAFARRLLALLKREKALRNDLAQLQKKQRSLKQDLAKASEQAHEKESP